MMEYGTGGKWVIDDFLFDPTFHYSILPVFRLGSGLGPR
jgi:hypothetical protein